MLDSTIRLQHFSDREGLKVRCAFKDPRDRGSTVDRTTCQYEDIVEWPSFAFAMGMATENGQFAIWMLSHDLQNYVAHRFASEVRQPIVVGQMPLMPTSFAKRRDVGEQDDVFIKGECVRQHFADSSGGFIAQSL